MWLIPHSSRARLRSTTFATSWMSPLQLLPTLLTILLACLPKTEAAKGGIGGVQMLYTSSAVYCSPPEAILISALDLKFYRENRTLEFDISAASVTDDLRVSVSVDVNAYGLGLFSLAIDLCGALDVLCPLPNYQFKGKGVFAVPEQFVEKIPTIAFTVPNLEAVATVELTDSSNTVVSCVQATLSNGKTTYQPAAKYAVLGVLLLAVVSSVLHTSLASSLGAAQWRVVDVFTTIQHVAMSALLSLNYPQVFTQFARNFAWSIGLIDIPTIQDSIVSTRLETGGTKDGIFGTLLRAESGKQYNPFTSAGVASGATSSYTSRPFTFLSLPAGASSLSADAPQVNSSTAYAAYSQLSQPLSFHMTNLGKRQIYAPYTGAGGQIEQNIGTDYLPLISSSTPPPTGIGLFAQLNNISPASAFLTVLVSLAMLFAVLIGICLVMFLFAAVLRLATRRPHGRVAAWSSRLTGRSFFGMFCRPLFGRFIMATFQVYLVFAFWQWLRGDSWVPDLLAAILLVVYLASIAVIYAPVFLTVRRGGKEELFYGKTPPANAGSTSRKWGAIAHPFRPKFFWFGLVFLLLYFIRACFISFAQGYGHGLRQSIGLAATDLLFFLVLCICRPGRDKTSDFVMIFLMVFRVISWGICIALTPLADIQTIPRVVLGFALIVVTGIPIIFLFLLTVWDLFSPFIRRRQWSATRIGDAEINEKPGYAFGAIGADGEGTDAAASNGQAYAASSPSGRGSEPSSGASSEQAPADSHLSPNQAAVPTQKSSLSRDASPATTTASNTTGVPVEHAPVASRVNQQHLSRPVPSHNGSAVSGISGQTVYHDANAEPTEQR
ncbi:related to FLC2-putative FAD transporter [Ustilago bromivora]|uniref:Related to FLC2 - putative FAD transporter n=1 Tax=Ustilago bromivora TaxID=307758 RepID=A0A1K0G2L6_9BASI|nr:related to FLC2-putative FAD transporter [Ustilago bromivora]SYW83211.1 related to FLC2 - putative FAD transporter [Ustilago bromivora]